MADSMHSPAIQRGAASLRARFSDGPVRKASGMFAYAVSQVCGAVPFLSIPAAIIDRGLADAQLNRELTGLWELVVALNERVSQLENLEDVIAEIAATVARNPDVQSKVERLMSSLGTLQGEFEVLAEDESFQHFQRVFIEAERVSFSASGTATNRLEEVDVRAASTRMHTTGRATNEVSDATFRGIGIDAHMHGRTQVGDVEVTAHGWRSAGAHGGFVSGNGAMIKKPTSCPECGTMLMPNPSALYTYMVNCPRCNARLVGRV
jgi:hypothetical protein